MMSLDISGGDKGPYFLRSFVFAADCL